MSIPAAKITSNTFTRNSQDKTQTACYNIVDLSFIHIFIGKLYGLSAENDI